MSPSPDLTEVSTGDLELVARGLRHASAELRLTEAVLRAWAVERSAARLAAVLGPIGVAGARCAIALLLAERRAHARSRLQLVWTADDSPRSVVRDTAALVASMFESAREHVLIAGYAFDNGATILRPLHEVMVRHGVRAQIVLDLKQSGGQFVLSEAQIAQQVWRFLSENWTFGAPWPSVYYDQRLTDPDSQAFFSMHAKAVVVDSRRTLVTSANFTSRAQTRNIELGVVIDDEAFARTVRDQFERAFHSGRFVPYELAQPTVDET